MEAKVGTFCKGIAEETVVKVCLAELCFYDLAF